MTNAQKVHNALFAMFNAPAQDHLAIPHWTLSIGHWAL